MMRTIDFDPTHRWNEGGWYPPDLQRLIDEQPMAVLIQTVETDMQTRGIEFVLVRAGSKTIARGLVYLWPAIDKNSKWIWEKGYRWRS